MPDRADADEDERRAIPSASDALEAAYEGDMGHYGIHDCFVHWQLLCVADLTGWINAQLTSP